MRVLAACLSALTLTACLPDETLSSAAQRHWVECTEGGRRVLNEPTLGPVKLSSKGVVRFTSGRTGKPVAVNAKCVVTVAAPR